VEGKQTLAIDERDSNPKCDLKKCWKSSKTPAVTGSRLRVHQSQKSPVAAAVNADQKAW